MNKTFDWKTSLFQLFAASVNQQTLEEAAELMVSVSAHDASYHDECVKTLEEAIRSAEAGDDFVISCINKSGYKVTTFDDALELLRDFRAVYLEEFGRASE